MRGIILAGGSGSRLWPATQAVSKQLLPVYDKPMIYYPLSVLMLAGVPEILVIATPDDMPNFQRLLADGAHFGCKLSYAEQDVPQGLVKALLLGENFIKDKPAALILGDNIFYGGGLHMAVKQAARRARGHIAVAFAYQVKDPERYGVVEFDGSGQPVTIEEKPAQPKSKFAVPGLYFYGPGVCGEASKVEPSRRGEWEISDLNMRYLTQGKLKIERLGRGVAWLDTGTPQSLLEASSFIQAIQERQGLMVACLEEIAYDNGWIDADQVRRTAESMRHSPYGVYLTNQVLAGGNR